MRCEKCGSTNVKVDFNTSYTSNPAKYSYCCDHCGEVGFINCDDVDIDDKISYLEGLGENIVNTPKKENNGGGLMGWVCPKCGRCYSPFTSMCPYCNNGLDWNGFKITC